MTTTDLEQYQPPTDRPLDRALALVGPGFELAERLSKTDLVPPAYKGKPESMLACFLYGDELGLSPMVALNEIFVERGRVGMTAKLMRAVVQRDGHDVWIEEQTDVMVKVGGQRRGSTHASFVTWTMDDAKRAGLDRKDNWKAHPKAMLLARASAQLCRIIGSDALAGISYAIEEIRDDFTEDVLEDELEDLERPAGAPKAPQPDNVRRLPRKKAAKKAASIPPPARKADDKGLEDFDEIDNHAADTSTEAPPAPPSTRAQMVAIRVNEALGRTPDRDERLRLIGAMVGHPVETSKDLAPQEVDAVLVDLDRLKAGALEWSNGELTEVAELVDEGDGSDEPTPDGSPSPSSNRRTDDEWRAFVTDKGVRVALVIKEAQRLAAEAGLETSPGTMVDIANLEDDGVLTALEVFVEDHAK